MRQPGTADDRRHSVLGKARRLSQLSLDAIETRELPRDDFGTYEVREVDVKTALTPCAMPGEPWSLNPYTGCSHACAYCYVPDVAHVERPRWGSYVLVKRNLPTVLSHEIHRKERRDVFLSSATDPYQPAEGTHQVTRKCLEILARADWPLGVLTRNPLVRRDALLLRRFTDVEVGMSVPTLDDELRRLVEPGAPTIEARLRTLRALADEGLDTYANLMPTYPLTGGFSPDDIARAFKDAGVKSVGAGAWRYLDTVVPVMRERLRGTGYEDVIATVQDRGYWQRTFRALERAFARAGVAFHVAYPEPHRQWAPLDWTAAER